MSRLVIGSRVELIAALRAQEAPLAAAEAAARAAAAAEESALRAAFEAQVAALRRALDADVAPFAAQRAPLAERRRAVAEELFLDALFLVAQFPGGQIAEAAKCCYAYDVRLCAGLCTATWAEEAFWSGLVRVRSGPYKRTRLMYAAAHGDARRVSWLLARGAPLEAKTVGCQTALLWASCRGHADAVRALLAEGASVDDASFSDITPLWAAAWDGHNDAMRALIAAGANIEAAAAGYSGWRPLHAASIQGHVAAATLLLNAGADVNACDNSGSSPLACATTPEMRALLIARGGA
jgi:hypothetical protein